MKKISSLILSCMVLAACEAGDAASIAVGTLERDRMALTTEAFEPIIEITVREGSRIKKGEILLQLDDTRAKIRLEAARAEERRASAFVSELEVGPRFETIKAARATLQGSLEALAEAVRVRDRAKKLVNNGTVSIAQYETATANVIQARARRDTAMAQLRELEEGTRTEVLDQARASLRKASLASAEAELHQVRHAIRAPADGTIEALPFEVGERPAIGQTVAVMLADTRPFARVYMPEAIKASLADDPAVTVHIEGRPEAWEGRLRFVSSDATFTPFFALTQHDRGNLSYVAEIDLVEEEAARLPTGLPLEVHFGGAK